MAAGDQQHLLAPLPAAGSAANCLRRCQHRHQLLLLLQRLLIAGAASPLLAAPLLAAAAPAVAGLRLRLLPQVAAWGAPPAAAAGRQQAAALATEGGAAAAADASAGKLPLARTVQWMGLQERNHSNNGCRRSSVFVGSGGTYSINHRAHKGCVAAKSQKDVLPPARRPKGCNSQTTVVHSSSCQRTNTECCHRVAKKQASTPSASTAGCCCAGSQAQ